MIQKNWQELIKPSKLAISQVGGNSNIATIVAEPLERGFGVTLGNALRRIMLSSLQGAAVTAIQVEGVLHEFSTIPGVREDLTDIVLNIKSLALRLHGEGPKRLSLKANKAGPVTAGMIETGHDVEVMDPDLVICTLDDEGDDWYDSLMFSIDVFHLFFAICQDRLSMYLIDLDTLHVRNDRAHLHLTLPQLFRGQVII